MHVHLLHTPSPPTKSLSFEGFDSSRLLILRVGTILSVEFDRESPGKFDSGLLIGKHLIGGLGVCNEYIVII